MTHPAAKTYLPLVRWSEEDQRYVGSCPPVIGDCCHGADPARVMRDILVNHRH
jgi:predicted RNase H-like HicB family nuclease